MEIYVRSRHYGTMLDTAGFELTDGPDKIYDLSRFQVGDKVGLFVSLTKRQHWDIENMRGYGLSSYGGSSLTDDYHAEIPFTVVEKKHYMGLRKPLGMSWAGTQIILEADSGYWEDVYLWVTQKIAPPWADKEEEAEK